MSAATNHPPQAAEHARSYTAPHEPSSQHQKRLLVISTGVNLGGAELMLLRLLRALQSRGFSPEIVSLTSHGALTEDFIAVGIPVTELNFKGGPRNVLSGLQMLIRIVRSGRPALIQTWMYHGNLIGGLIARLFSPAPCVWSIRHSTIDRHSTSVLTRMVVKAGAFISGIVPRAIISCSQGAIDAHTSTGYDPQKMIYIPNGFDSDLFHPDAEARRSVREEFAIPSAAPLVGMFGRYHPQKNFEGFCEVAQRILSRHPDTFFLAAGTNVTEDNTALTQMLKRANIDSRVRLAGPRRDIPRLSAALDVLLSTARYGEAFPNVIAEVMLCGVPCVGFDVGDTKIIIDDVGFTIPVGNITMMADKVSQIIAALASKPYFDPASIRRSIAERFSIEVVAEQYAELYHRLILEQSGASPT